MPVHPYSGPKPQLDAPPHWPSHWLKARDTSTPLEIRVLRLQPGACPAAQITRADALRDDAFQAHPAGVAKDGGAVAGERLTELDAVAHGLVAAREQARESEPSLHCGC